jgi:hypothetical protein
LATELRSEVRGPETAVSDLLLEGLDDGTELVRKGSKGLVRVTEVQRFDLGMHEIRDPVKLRLELRLRRELPHLRVLLCLEGVQRNSKFYPSSLDLVSIIANFDRPHDCLTDEDPPSASHPPLHDPAQRDIEVRIGPDRHHRLAQPPSANLSFVTNQYFLCGSMVSHGQGIALCPALLPHFGKRLSQATGSTA